MGQANVLEIAILGWILIATAVLVYMTRRGHDPAKWVVIAFVSGPLSPFFALWARHLAGATESTTLQWGSPGPGPLSVLIGIDGSGPSHRALIGALEVLGDRIGRLTLVEVIPFDSAASAAPSRARIEAELTLKTAARIALETTGLQARTVVLAGAPAQALIDYAVRSDDELIVIGTHGKGDADWLEGSVARTLARERRVRVIILGAPDSA